jgi:signal transduction histidine kinase
MPGPENDTVAGRLAWAAQQLGGEHTRDELLGRIVALAPHVVPGTEHASITLTGPAGLTTPTASGVLPWQLDALQYEAGQGPCIDATRDGWAVVVPDLTVEARWPRLVTQLARQMPRQGRVRGVLALPLRTESGTTGSLNLSSAAAQAFSTPRCDAGSALAAMAAAALAAVEQRERAATREAQAENFVAALAHDLRSGMSVALTAHEMLTKRRAALDARGQEALDLLADELSRQRQLLVDLLDLVRARAGARPPASIALLPAVHDAVRRQRHRVAVQARPRADTALVAIHPVPLTRIVSNLLDNADRHAGGATAVQVGCSGDRAWVAVEDAGPGVPQDQRERVFTRFATAPNTTKSGVHLGLALSRQHARWAGGDLLVTDRDGGVGARFVLLLPVAPPNVPLAREKSSGTK